MTKNAAVNLSEMVSEARIQMLIKEEEQLTSSSTEIQQLKQETLGLLVAMEEAALVNDEAKRREYRNEVVVKNLRLVTQVLKKYGYFSPDKFQNGCIGLLKAAETFKLEKGVPFANYACFCIETEVRLAFKRVNRAFESKVKGYLDSIDAPVPGSDGTEISKHDMVQDPFAAQEFDTLIDDAEVDTLFYEIIIPVIEEYGVRTSDNLDMELWRQLEIQYFIEMSMEDSQRQRITLSEMARQLGTVTQNLRIRHKKVLKLVKERCREYGYFVQTTPAGASRIVKEWAEDDGTVSVKRLNKKR